MAFSPRTILKNFFSLSIAEIANKGLTFITMAYLARILSPEGFGVIGASLSVISYFLAFINLGFLAVGSREVARDKSKSEFFVNSIVSARLLLSVIGSIVLVILVFLLDKPEETKIIFLITGLNMFSTAILLDWYWWGIEKMSVLALRQSISSAMYLIGVLLFVKSRNDMIIATAVYVSTIFINSVWMFILYNKKYFKFKFNVNFKAWRNLLFSSGQVFVTNAVIVVLSNFHITILTLFATNYDIGIFSAALKIFLLTNVAPTVLQNTFLPSLSRATTIEERQMISKHYSEIIFFFGCFISVVLFTNSEFVMNFTFGSQYSSSYQVMQLLMIASLFASSLNMSCLTPLITWNKEKSVMVISLIVVVINISMNLLLTIPYGTTGAAAAQIITEVSYSFLMFYLVYKAIKKIYLLNFLKYLAIAVLSCSVFYLLKPFDVHSILIMLISGAIYLALNVVFKTITLSKIKGLLQK